jgi:hypothetical protein
VGRDERNVEAMASMAMADEAGTSSSAAAYPATGGWEKNPVFSSRRKRTARERKEAAKK